MNLQRTSAAGRDFIAREEGIVPYAYNDSRRNATFGIGHLLHLGPATRKDGLLWGTKRLPRPHSFVMLVFKRDLRKYEAAVRRAVGGRKLRQFEFDALVSLAVNIGEGGIVGSTTAREIRKGRGDGNFRAAANAILLWDNPPELRGRRERERLLFLTGRYR